jgi:MoaA/NifB/PqqE/SkfB family radical SAM enzyme
MIDNEETSILRGYDHLEKYKDNIWPTSMSFAISNACNYECLMCGGSWSSSIRKNREKKPPIKIPYDDNFVEELKDFIPHLKDVRMSGGEPFLNSFTYKILDLFIELNPNIEIVITSNGSILNSKIKNYIDKLKNLKISISLDAVNKKTYELIRKNSNFELVMNNMDYFISKNVLSGIAVCPIIQNIYEILDIVDFCISKNIDFYFNNVYYPLGGYIKDIHNLPNEKHDSNKLPLVCLNTLRKSEKINIAKYLKSKKYEDKPEIQKSINGLINKVLLD